MTLCQLILCFALVLVNPSNARSELRSPLLPGKNVISIIPELLGKIVTVAPVTASLDANPGSGVKPEVRAKNASTSDEVRTESIFISEDTSSEPPQPLHPVQHAGLPQGLAVSPLPLKDSYHELMFNVSWQQSFGRPARDYSLEISSLTDTIDCHSPMCYEYNIPGEVSWWEIPAYNNPVTETCVLRPGCTYRVRLIAHPWDGHTSANLDVALDECVAGVCSCAHSPRLPVPDVKAYSVSIQGEIYVNVSWISPKPTYPQRLPPGLKRRRYAVSIAKQMVSDAHRTPWYANTAPPRFVDADGLVDETDTLHLLLLPITDRCGKKGDERRDKRITKPRNIVLDVRLLARVTLVDDRGCFGREGNATAYDPVLANKQSFWTYVLWAAFGGACVVAMGALVAASARVVKRVLNAFRPAPVSAPLDPLSRCPAWLPLQLRTIRKQLSESQMDFVLGDVKGAEPVLDV